MTWSDSRRTPIEMLAEDFSRRLQAGDHPTIDEYLVNYPSYAEGIRSLFPIIAILEEAKPQDDSHPTVVVDEPALPAQTVFGDFVIQREVGRGGMGIVYEAMQSSLNRRVALEITSQACGVPVDKLAEDTDRCLYLDAEGAKAYGIIDKIVTKVDKGPQNSLNEGLSSLSRGLG